MALGWRRDGIKEEGAYGRNCWDTKQWQNRDATGRLGSHPNPEVTPHPKQIKLNMN